MLVHTISEDWINKAKLKRTFFYLTFMEYLSSWSIQNGLAGRSEVKVKSFSTQLSSIFILLINVKMPSLVCILSSINGNTTSDNFKVTSTIIFHYIFEHFNF